MSDRTREMLSPEEFEVRGRRSFLTGLGAAALGLAGLTSINTAERVDRIPGPLRSVHEVNGRVWQHLFREDALAPTFDPSRAGPLLVNGSHGLDDDLDPATWSLEVVSSAGDVIGTNVMADIEALPFVEMTVEHKCVEGWSQIVTWGGARFSDFAALYGADSVAPFVGLETPDGDYYVSLDRASMLHQQTMLTWMLNGERLTPEHGAPVRLTTPLKYGIKQIKRIGRITFAEERPSDYWAERGYDWYSGL